MTNNPILDELRETRERLLADAGGTLEGLVARLQHDERRSDREFVHPSPRASRCSPAAKSGALPMDDQAPPPDDR